MQDNSISAAINAALKCDWSSAICVNSKILKEMPNDIDCLNRLGKAYLEQGDNKKATFYFRKVLKIDKYNPIAQKNLARANDSTKTKTSKNTVVQATTPSPVNLLEEPGKTRLVALVNVAPPAILLKQNTAGNLNLFPKRHTVILEDAQGNYLGALPDDLGHRLSVLMKGGNRYEAIVKSLCRNNIVVFLRETYRDKKFHNTPSFIATSSPDYLSYLREDVAGTQETKATITSELEEPDSADGQDEESSSSKLHRDEEPETRLN